MQTTHEIPDASDTSSEQDLLQHLLQQQPPKQQAHQASDPVHGVVLGRVIALRTDGKLDISLDSLGIAHAIASPICAPQTLFPGIAIAVMFEQGNIERALILGAMHGGTHAKSTSSPSPEIYVDQQRVVIAAERELELRCGEAAIVLTADGRILTRGNYISSLATATQRIRGGAVQIN